MLENNTTQQLGRTEEVTRDVAWEQAFLAQLTDELADSVAAFAKKRASWLNGKRKRKDDFLWKELYQDAITDTWTGDVTWDPYKAPLDLHLKRVIRSRTSMTIEGLNGRGSPRSRRHGAISPMCRTASLLFGEHKLATEDVGALDELLRSLLEVAQPIGETGSLPAHETPPFWSQELHVPRGWVEHAHAVARQTRTPATSAIAANVTSACS